MASLTLYGSSVADATLTTACDMANTTGGTGTTKTTTVTGSNNYAEITSQGLTVASVTAIPATPTGNGWVYKPGAGTFATGNWSASINLDSHGWSGSSTTTNTTLRAFKYSSGTYTSIGTWATVAVTSTSLVTYTYPNTSFSTVTLGASDYVYFDFWWFDGTGAGTDNPIISVSTSSSQGVANDMQITTSSFTASSIHFNICDGYGGVFS